MRLLITGCNGQLGRSLGKLIGPDGALFTDVEELDVTDEKAVGQLVEGEGIDTIINCAAYTAVDRAESDQDRARLLNAVAPGILARVMERVGGRLVHVSTDYVFNGRACAPYRETDEPDPQSVYGRTKLEGEQAVLEECRDAVIVRTAWLYSPYGNNFVKTMLRLGRERDEIGVVYDQVGSPTYAPDLAEACLRLAQRDREPGIYNYTDEGAVSWYDFARAIHRLAGITTCRVNALLTEQYPTPAARPHYSVLDKQKVKDAGIRVPYWEESLEHCIKEIVISV